MNVRFERLYNIWTLMKQRCYNQNNKGYKYYGARGIRVADCWLHDYHAFKKWAFENGYKENLTIERIDNNKGYEPNNCKWIEKSEQSLNRSMNFYFTYKGKTQCLSEWCKELGLSNHYSAIKNRIIDLGMTFEDAVNTQIKNVSAVDISGMRFGFLKAIKYSHKKGKHGYWMCMCDCGNEKYIRKDHLIGCKIISCGCIKTKKQLT